MGVAVAVGEGVVLAVDGDPEHDGALCGHASGDAPQGGDEGAGGEGAVGEEAVEAALHTE